ncbi:hypothetical protein MNBD_ALPHA12-1907 [hydrothermal vent metagenome]|uniref:Uncharacterized protein n=1 Tax=hydrothermal vent metagenome TaxID=652676 RepID=A0A3B0US91_9ZZZZ
MDFYGSYLLLANRQTIWRALNDTMVLKTAIPGCHHIEWVSESALELKIKVNLGIVHPIFSGQLELSDIEPAKNYVLKGRGHGRILGLAHGSAAISLSDVDQFVTDQAMRDFVSQLKNAADAGAEAEITWLRFSATGGASERIMKLGKKIVGGSAQRVIDRFFVGFAAAIDTHVHVLPGATGANKKVIR